VNQPRVEFLRFALHLFHPFQNKKQETGRQLPARSPQAAILSHEDDIGRKIASFPFQAATSTTAGFCLGQTVTAVETGQKAIPQGCVLLLYYIVIIYVFSAIYVTLFQSRCQVLFEPSRQKTCRTTIHLGQVKKKRAETGRYLTDLHFSLQSGKTPTHFSAAGAKKRPGGRK
jgi:hypothetical protein